MKRILAALLTFCFLFALAGCSKDEVAGSYNKLLIKLGDIQLTDNFALEGERHFGDDHFVGSYFADYDGFSGIECLFGGTGIQREGGSRLTVKCRLKTIGGNAKLLYERGGEDPEVLIETAGTIEKTIDLPPGGNYFKIDCDDFYGLIELSIEDAWI